MPSVVRQFFGDLDFDKLKFVRPTKFVFLCGGAVDDSNPKQFSSLRDFIVKNKSSLHVDGDFVLAEDANKLYESTKYKDLISFEEDIARIAAVILVITESPGSLAELGAFASHDPLKSSLRLIVQEKHESDKSFIREGPVRRIERQSSKNVAYFDWEIDTSNIVTSDIAAHKDFIFDFVNQHIKKVSKKRSVLKSGDQIPFFILLWVIFVSEVISFDLLLKIAREINSSFDKNDLANKLFCMQLARWICRKKYGHKVYFYTTFKQDPFDYVFRDAVADKDGPRRKSAAAADIEAAESVPQPVRDAAIAARSNR